MRKIIIATSRLLFPFSVLKVLATVFAAGSDELITARYEVIMRDLTTTAEIISSESSDCTSIKILRSHNDNWSLTLEKKPFPHLVCYLKSGSSNEDRKKCLNLSSKIINEVQGMCNEDLADRKWTLDSCMTYSIWGGHIQWDSFNHREVVYKRYLFRSPESYKIRDWKWVIISENPYFASYSPTVGAGVGPNQTVEVSPYVKSIKIFCTLKTPKLANDLEFVFDPKDLSFYTKNTLEGHPKLKTLAIIDEGRCLGGEFRWVDNNILRTNEMSGHYGKKWTDKARFSLIHMMSQQGIHILHEPYHEGNLFYYVSNDELELYQRNFMRSFFNPVYYSAIYLANTPDKAEKKQKWLESGLYLEEGGGLKLKPKFENTGPEDRLFKFIDVSTMKTLLLDSFRQRYAKP
jgi:hypothetical protein